MKNKQLSGKNFNQTNYDRSIIQKSRAYQEKQELQMVAGVHIKKSISLQNNLNKCVLK